MTKTFLPYATVSLAVLLLDMTVFTLLIELDWNPLVATFLGYTSGHIFNFTLARRYVFDKENVVTTISCGVFTCNLYSTCRSCSEYGDNGTAD